jgi:hypothetical protein
MFKNCNRAFNGVFGFDNEQPVLETLDIESLGFNFLENNQPLFETLDKEELSCGVFDNRQSAFEISDVESLDFESESFFDSPKKPKEQTFKKENNYYAESKYRPHTMQRKENRPSAVNEKFRLDVVNEVTRKCTSYVIPLSEMEWDRLESLLNSDRCHMVFDSHNKNITHLKYMLYGKVPKQKYDDEGHKEENDELFPFEDFKVFKKYKKEIVEPVDVLCSVVVME